MYALADMFFLETLKAESACRLEFELATRWTSDPFPDCVREVYTTTPPDDSIMRSVILKAAKLHARELGVTSSFQELIREGGDFAVDYVGSITATPAGLAPRSFATTRAPPWRFEPSSGAP